MHYDGWIVDEWCRATTLSGRDLASVYVPQVRQASGLCVKQQSARRTFVAPEARFHPIKTLNVTGFAW